MSIFRKSNKKASSRSQIAIKGVEDGILILPGNRYRMILQVSSINFELKSEDEQDALIDTYQNFLNSLACPLQMIIRVREMDMDKYLEEFRFKIDGEKEKVYRQQIKNYIEFVQGLITKNKILARHFYVVIPFNGKDRQSFEMIKEQLLLNSDIVTKGLARLGVHTHQLNSLEVLDLFYTFYNPHVAKRQPLTEQTMRLLKESYL